MQIKNLDSILDTDRLSGEQERQLRRCYTYALLKKPSGFELEITIGEYSRPIIVNITHRMSKNLIYKRALYLLITKVSIRNLDLYKDIMAMTKISHKKFMEGKNLPASAQDLFDLWERTIKDQIDMVKS